MTNDNGTQPQQPHPLTPDEKKRVTRCQRAIKKALTRHQCLIVPQVTITGTNLEAAIHILPRPS